MNVLQISADRSSRGLLFQGTPAYLRQRAYAESLGSLDVVAFSRTSDHAEVIHDGPLSIHPTNSRFPLLYLWDAYQIARTLGKPDIVVAQDPFETGLVACFLAKRLNVPLYVQVHTDVYSPAYARHSLPNRIRVWLVSFVLRRATRIRVVSKRIERSLTKRFKHLPPISVLPIFVDTHPDIDQGEVAVLRERFARFDTKLLVVARLEKEKQISLAIKTFSLTAPKSACLIIVGSGRERLRLEWLAKQLQVADRVFFEGTRESAPYLSFADLVLVTSMYEGYGLVIVEALAAGKPVLSTDVGVAAEAGAIVSPEDEFPAALSRWFEKGPRHATLPKAPYTDFDEYVRQYSADIVKCAGK